MDKTAFSSRVCMYSNLFFIQDWTGKIAFSWNIVRLACSCYSKWDPSLSTVMDYIKRESVESALAAAACLYVETLL